MDEILRRLQKSKQKLDLLEQTLQQVVEEREQLLSELDSLREELAIQSKAYDELAERYEALKVVKSLNGEVDREAIRKQIDLYLEEIDICLKNLGE